MKKGKGVLFGLIICVAIIGFTLISCDFFDSLFEEPGHVHSYGGFQTSSTEHWRVCNVPGCTAQSERGNHSGDPCTVCGFYTFGTGSHTHSYGGWQKSATEHWKVCTFPGCTAQSERDNHSGDTCTVCGYVSSGGGIVTHTHLYSGDWQTSSTEHWKECTASGCTVPPAQSERSDHSGDPCTVCGYVSSGGGTVTHTHSYGGWQTSLTEHWKVCTVPGCTVPPAENERGNHTAGGGLCEVCGFNTDFITLSPESPTATVSVSAGDNGRLRIIVNTPPDSPFVVLKSSGDLAGDPALYNSAGTQIADNAYGGHWQLAIINSGQTTTVFAGTADDTGATYTVTAEFASGGSGGSLVTMDRTRDRAAIIAKAKSLPHSGFDSRKTTQYAVAPSFSPPYSAGSLNADDIADALNALKMVRYLAGLPYENVAFTAPLNNIAQHGSVLLSSSNQFTHTPTQPADMPQDFYDIGRKGCAEANIFSGLDNIAMAVLGFISDVGEGNIASAGHRRWVLKPGGQNYGIGYASHSRNDTINMHVFDGSAVQFDTYISWPSSGDIPIQYFIDTTYMDYAPPYPWSINLGAAFAVPVRSEIQITLTRTRDNKVWSFNSATPRLGVGNMSPDSLHLAVDNDGYGMGKAIIFRPDVTTLGTIKDGDVFIVSLSGISLTSGIPAILEYRINFFDLVKAMQ